MADTVTELRSQNVQSTSASTTYSDKDMVEEISKIAEGSAIQAKKMQDDDQVHYLRLTNSGKTVILSFQGVHPDLLVVVRDYLAANIQMFNSSGQFEQYTPFSGSQPAPYNWDQFVSMLNRNLGALSGVKISRET
jgi:hypothetical protein